MSELVVIASHDPELAVDCVTSWQACGVTSLLLLDTGLGTVPGADENVGPVWQTGAFLHAYREYDVDAYLFTQDTITVIGDDPVGWFRERMPHTKDRQIGAVGWQLFPLAWDTETQRAYVEDWYADDIAEETETAGDWVRPPVGIVGPVFYVTRRTLDRLNAFDLMPPVPSTREQAAGTERAWAYAFALAGVPLTGEPFLPDEVPARVTEHGPLRKVWMH